MTRKIQPVSFNLDDVYENKLREYAMEQNKYFSKYVKWLIEKHRSGELGAPAKKVESIPVSIEETRPVKFGKAAAGKFI